METYGLHDYPGRLFIVEEYNRMIKPYNFQVINATLPVEQIAEQLKERIIPLLPQSGDLY